jgi:hypothetical protein
MNLPKPFSFPTSAPGRKHGPAGYDNYQTYKDWLRDEFVFRCAYCLERETWYPSRHAAFAVDHILPKVKWPELLCDYDNLVYACLRCNSLKQDIVTLDPCRIALGKHIHFKPDGSVVGRTRKGKEFVLLFHLDVAPAIDVRNEKLMILRLKIDHPDNSEVARLFQVTFGYPEALPDLRRPAKQPKSNSRPKGVRNCHFVRKLKRQLPEVY